MVLPWVLIIGVWLWLSRRAQQMMVAGGGPLGAFLKRGKKFEKATASRRDVRRMSRACRRAKRDLAEIVSS